ncbi:protoporphyrinogen oxidase [Rhodoblastus acidophilus]|uniref:NAD(P)/FAD-dependent oxidoreductase n=1 Tax=Rhodoblastus acidophilus TaxID=1074 RepID=UPI0022248FD3|nr:NAD(P)/FAD-dependent oxidoreductase [Rhodoblastus acidophilus]MCW2284705.1 protoporphyrinogen oxidase [Rhodoblastus acidophilus]MCW2333658.1 protoporphyrinogen oxidase [Rhodoblastus acidophilus]
MSNDAKSVLIVGAGFTGLAAAYELARAGVKVTIVEWARDIGGLASAFDVGGTKLDRFYHHWFTNDAHVMALIDELGLTDQVRINPTNTGVYYANSFFKLSTPLDLLRFSPLGLFDRIRLGLLALRARRVKAWMALEDKTAADWLRELGGERVFKIVWQPLLKGKFGPHAEEVSAVWFWNKIKLRGGSRGKAGEERLAYYKGGFVALAEAIAAKIVALGGTIQCGAKIDSLAPVEGKWRATSGERVFEADRVLVTTALPVYADLIAGWAAPDYLDSLRRISYLGNVCLVLELDRSLSSTYWLNVNDASFPFVGVIEHTNFEGPENYGGRHIVYLSKYLPETDRLFLMSDDEIFDYALPYLQAMFPKLEKSWVLARHVWRARWSQPVVGKHYSRLIPAQDGPLPGLHLCTMAQIYPEDRGTNYAIREGRAIGRRLAAEM